MSFLKKLRRDETGGTMIEYALIVALVAGVGLVAFQGLGPRMTAAFTNATNALPSSTPTP